MSGISVPFLRRPSWNVFGEQKDLGKESETYFIERPSRWPSSKASILHPTFLQSENEVKGHLDGNCLSRKPWSAISRSIWRPPRLSINSGRQDIRNECSEPGLGSLGSRTGPGDMHTRVSGCTRPGPAHNIRGNIGTERLTGSAEVCNLNE